MLRILRLLCVEFNSNFVYMERLHDTQNSSFDQPGTIFESKGMA